MLSGSTYSIDEQLDPPPPLHWYMHVGTVCSHLRQWLESLVVPQSLPGTLLNYPPPHDTETRQS